MNSILNSYVHLTKFITLAFGPQYQSVLYDVSRDDFPIISVCDNHVAGVKVGEVASPQIAELIKKERYQKTDYRCSFNYTDIEHQKYRTSLYFIRENNVLVGVLGIFFDDSKFVDLASELMKLIHPDEIIAHKEKTLKDSDNITTRIYNTIEEYLTQNHMIAGHFSKYEFDTTIAYLSQDRRVEIVAKLEKKGIFKIKGAVVEVANILQISEPSIYRYLNKLKKGEK